MGPTIVTDLPIAGDNVINRAEQSEVVIKGSTTGVESGQIVTVVITDLNGNTVKAMGKVAADGSWTTDNLDLSELDEGDLTVESSVEDSVGNSASDSDTVLKDTQIEAAIITDTLLVPGYLITANGGIEVMPSDDTDLSSMQISYLDESGSSDAAHTLLINYDSASSQWQFAPDQVVQSGINLDADTGQVVFDFNRVLDGSNVTVSLKDTSGNVIDTSHQAKEDYPLGGGYLENRKAGSKVFFEVINSQTTTLIEEVETYVFKDSGTTISADGFFRIEINADKTATVYMTEAGAASSANDFEVEPNFHDYEILALDSADINTAKVLYERNINVSESDVNEVTAQSVKPFDVNEDNQYHKLFDITLNAPEDPDAKSKYLAFKYEASSTATIDEKTSNPDADIKGLIFVDAAGNNIPADKLSQSGDYLVIDKSITSFSIQYRVVADDRTEGAETVTISVDGQQYTATINDTSVGDTSAPAARTQSVDDSDDTYTLSDPEETGNIDLGAGDDTLIIASSYDNDAGNAQGLILDGGDGFDTVILAGSNQQLSLDDGSNNSDQGITGFESYDLTGADADSANTLLIADAESFTANALLDDSTGVSKLFVTGDENDTVDWQGDKVASSTDSFQGVTYDIYTDNANNQLWIDQDSGITVI